MSPLEPPRARRFAVLGGTRVTAAVDFVHGDVADGEGGPLMAPAYVVPRLLERTGLVDFGLVEVDEAFASQAPATLAAREKRGLPPADRARRNVAGLAAVLERP